MLNAPKPVGVGTGPLRNAMAGSGVPATDGVTSTALLLVGSTIAMVEPATKFKAAAKAAAFAVALAPIVKVLVKAP